MSDDILREQLAYYRARAQEYDESVQQTGRFATPEPQDQQIDAEWAQIVRALHALPPCDEVLELACGTGIWTQELLQVGKTITALDGAPKMLELNRAKIASPRVQYETADLFAWQPIREYDLVFFAFWLSHVPPEQLGSFLDKVAHAIRPAGVSSSSMSQQVGTSFLAWQKRTTRRAPCTMVAASRSLKSITIRRQFRSSCTSAGSDHSRCWLVNISSI